MSSNVICWDIRVLHYVLTFPWAKPITSMSRCSEARQGRYADSRVTRGSCRATTMPEVLKIKPITLLIYALSISTPEDPSICLLMRFSIAFGHLSMSKQISRRAKSSFELSECCQSSISASPFISVSHLSVTHDCLCTSGPLLEARGYG